MNPAQWYRCGTAVHAAHEAVRASGTVRGRRRSLTVDLHCHVLTPAVEQLVASAPQKLSERELQTRMMGAESYAYTHEVMLKAAAPKLTDLSVRLQDMDAMGVDLQLLSPAPNQYYYWAEPDLARSLCRLINEHIAALVAQHPDRLLGLGSVALQHPQLALEQLEYAVRTLGLRGVEVSSLVNGLELADPSFERFWARAEQLGCLVFVHPLGSTLGERLNRHYLSNIIGQPLETAVALSYLIFGGTLDRHPGLKILAAHGGGYAAAYIGRSDHAWRARPDARGCRELPSSYLRRIYFDTIVYRPEQLRHLIAEVGVQQIVVGTDYPYDMAHYDLQGLLDAVPGLSESERAAILGGNAARLLELEPA
ncbi:MAG: amidohydrolase family protein [Steroidobacteraceae bacterium]